VTILLSSRCENNNKYQQNFTLIVASIMNIQSIVGKEKIVTISPTDVKRISDPYNDCNHKIKKGDYNDNDNDDDSISSESLQDNVNSATASSTGRWDSSSGTVSFLFTDDEEYDYTKSTIDEDDIDDDDDDDDDEDTAGHEKNNAVPRTYIRNNGQRNNETTTTRVHTTNRRRSLNRKHNNSQLSDITFDSDHYYDTSTERISLNGTDRFSPNYCSMPRRFSNSSSTSKPPSMPMRNHSNH